MKIRCDLHVNGDHRRLVLAGQESETFEHLALKLGAFLLLWEYDPKVHLTTDHPALQGQPFKPDLMALDETGAVRLWAECGRVSLHKLDKLTRRYPTAKLLVLKASEDEAKRLRKDASEGLDRSALLEIWGWPAAEFKRWQSAVAASDQAYAVGETYGRTLNLVLNETPIDVELKAF